MAEDVEGRKTMATEVKLEELMEVVTSYKCRFCEFTCSGVPEMSEHLQKTHVVGNAVKPPSLEQGAAAEDLAGEMKSNNTPEPELACEEEDEGQSESQGSDEVPALLSNLGLAPITGPSSPSLSVQPSLPDPKVLTNQVRSVAKNLSIMASSPQDLGLFSLTSSTGTQNLPITSLQLTGPLVTSSTTIDAISVPVLDTTKDLGTGPTSIAPITRELFLCGVCSMGFISVDECKYHMEREHNSPVETSSVSDTVVDKYEQRVSVGTQATGKRPGRKRKSEMPPPVSSPQVKKVKEEVEDDNDEDWLPGRSLSSGTRDGKQRRKIRTPKALKEDYVIEKKRKYRKRRMAIKESYTLSCSYLGCSTKFRCQESLDIHLDCHNKEDDAFTCPNCPEVFDFWKPLRIHLWRSHNVDCDMFQCDMCDYKTDTLHKLGVHREIHSDNRPYTCDVCGKGFKQLSQMKNHQIIHAEHQRSGRDSWFSNKICDVCKRSFANSKCLKKHVEAVHGQNKPFKCQYCGHTTAWKAMLILHERTHTGEKPFKCDVCPYATGDHNSLRRHKMRHTGQRQYKCQLCTYTCIQTISLKTHMRNKHPNAEGVVYMCQMCKFRTINKQIYDNHMEDHRNGLIPEAKDAVPSAQQSTLEAVSTQSSEPTVSAQQSTLAADQMVTSTAPVPEGSVLYQLQVKRMYTGELHANKEDIDKLNSLYEVVHSGMDANQLIYSALHIGSQNQIASLTYSTQLANGIQCTVSPSTQPSKGVLTSYLITFCSVPSSESHPEMSDQTMVYQTLTDQGVSVGNGASQDEASQPSAEQDSEAGLTLAEVSQAQNVESVSHILYTQVPQVINASANIQEDQGFPEQPNSDFSVMQAAGENPTPADKGIGSVERAADSVSSAGAVAVSEAGHVVEGMEGVLLTESGRSIVVMEGGQVVEGMLVMAAQEDQADLNNIGAAESEGQQGEVVSDADGATVEAVDSTEAQQLNGCADADGSIQAEMVDHKGSDDYSTLLQETDVVASEEQS